MKIIIVGGGIGGVAAAVALRRAGAEPLVLEQAPELTQVGAGVNISANGMKALVQLGADRHVRETSVYGEGAEFNDLETGETIARLYFGSAGEKAWGEAFYHVYRADLLDALLQQLPAEHLRLNCTVTTIEDQGSRVNVRLADGTEIAGDAIVGADGLKSTVRTALFGEGESRPTGYLAWRSLIHAAGAPIIANRPLGRTWIGPRRHVVFYPVAGGALLNFVGFVPDDEVARRESWTTSGDVAELKASFAGSCEEVQTIIDGIDEAFITAIHFREPLSKWGSGRVVLLGDAAHPVPPSAAQGACMALEDAVMLGGAFERFADRRIERVFSEYAARRKPRTARLFGTAMNNFRMFNQSDPEEVRGRNGRFRGLARLDPLSESTWGWLYSYDVVAGIDEPPQGLVAAALLDPLERPEARAVFESWRDALRPTDLAQGEAGMRIGYDRFMRATAPDDDSTTAPVVCGRTNAVQVKPDGVAEGPVVLHIHGGLFTMGSAAASAGYAARLARAVGGWALVPDYRLAPEHEFPAALEDVIEAYRWVRERADGPVLVSGLDAGAGLGVSLALSLRDAGAQVPDGLFLISPLCDLQLEASTIASNAATDPWISRQFLAVQAASYLHGHDPAEPLISPLYADLTGLPPMVIQAAAQEALAADAERLAARASEFGVDVRLTLVEDSVHDFTLFADLPETREAIAELESFPFFGVGARGR